MPWLVHADAAAAGKRNGRGAPPSGRFNGAALDLFCVEGCDHSIEIVTHQVKHGAQQLVASMVLRELSFERVNASFGGRHGEDHPTLADIDEGKF